MIIYGVVYSVASEALGGELYPGALWPLPSHVKALVRLSCAFTSIQTRNSSGDEIANVNFLYDDIVHVL